MLATPAVPDHAQAPLTSRVTVFTGVSVITMEDERILPDQTVLVRDGRIARLGPSAGVAIPEGATRIDGRGKYLAPGLSDMHVHFGTDAAVNEAVSRLYLAYGVTSVLNLNGKPEHLALRDRIARGKLLGPTIYTSGPILDDSTLGFADGERLVEEQASAGYQFIKVYNRLSRAAYWGIVSTARRVGIPVVGHVVRGLDSYGLARCEPSRVVCFCEHCLEATLTSGQVDIVHLEELIYGHFNYHATKHPRNVAELVPDIAPLARRIAASGVWVTPTLEVYLNIPRQLDSLPQLLSRPEIRNVPRAMRERWEPANNPYLKRFSPDAARAMWEQARFADLLTKGLHDAGVKLLAGTDVGVPAVMPGLSLHWELQHFVRAGLSPWDALVTATRSPAAFFGVPAEAGTVSVGKAADLILLDGNPLARIEHTTRIAGVMVRGRWLDRGALDRMLREAAETP